MRRTRISGRTLALSAGALLLGLVLVAGLSAHDFWLVPDAFRVTAGSELRVRGVNSSRFPTPQLAWPLEKIVEAKVLDATGDTRIKDLSHAENNLLLRYVPTTPGQRIVAIALRNPYRLNPEGFRGWIRGEGAAEAADRLEREGKMPTDSVTLISLKFAKTFVEVGDGPRAWTRSAGHTLELMPLSDPAKLKAGETLSVRIMFRGNPLAGANIHAGAAPAQPLPANERPKFVTLRSDNEGIVRVPLPTAGMWNVRMIHLAEALAIGAEWESHWATIVFNVNSGTTTAGRGD